MRIIKLLSLSLVALLSFSACSDDDDAPELINEEEVITTLNVYLTPDGGTEELAFSYTDLDGDGSNPEIVTSNLSANTTYSGRVEFLNEQETPADNITLEVIEEDLDHQVFYTISESLDLVANYEDEDPNGNPLGVEFTLNAGNTGSGNLTVTLIHEGDKDASGASEGVLSPSVGGETDIERTFEVTIE